jgi:TolB-like protein
MNRAELADSIDAYMAGNGLTMLKIIALALVFVAGCSFGSGNVQSKHSSDLEARRIRRIAVLPPETSAGIISNTSPTQPLSQQNDAPEMLAKQIYSAMASLPNWQIIADTEVQQVEQTKPAVTGAARLRQVGEKVFADAVIVGRMQRFRERVGDDWGVKSPASVAFVLELVDVRRGDVIWSARFDETQKALSENIFALGDISQRGVRWLSAEQLAMNGVKKAVGQLHQILARPASS